MNRDELVAALTGHRPGAEIQVDVMGFLIDVTAITFDDRRDAIVIELFAEDVDDVLTRTAQAGSGNPPLMRRCKADHQFVKRRKRQYMSCSRLT